MATRPDTIAAALVDSPAGLAAWIIDKYRATDLRSRRIHRQRGSLN